MILVDKDIDESIREKGELIDPKEYKQSNLNGVSYDLTIDVIYDKEEKTHPIYELKPGETVFVKTEERLLIPHNILGRIAEKNSLMRQGLVVAGPHYQPGHHTYAFLRVRNISESIFSLHKGMKIAQIMFEQLSDIPDMPYDKQPGASFQDEEKYRGLGNYKEEYEQQTINQVEKAKEDVEEISHKIYANVLTLMGILVSVFGLLTINYQAFQKAEITTHFILVMNLTLALSIVILMGIILVLVNKAKDKKFLWTYIAILILLAIATGVACA